MSKKALDGVKINLNPNSIKVKYSLIVLGGGSKKHPGSLLPI